MCLAGFLCFAPICSWPVIGWAHPGSLGYTQGEELLIISSCLLLSNSIAFAYPQVPLLFWEAHVAQLCPQPLQLTASCCSKVCVPHCNGTFNSWVIPACVEIWGNLL